MNPSPPEESQKDFGEVCITKLEGIEKKLVLLLKASSSASEQFSSFEGGTGQEAMTNMENRAAAVDTVAKLLSEISDELHTQIDNIVSD